jgi:exosome complex RNA-binding protein Rrp42 (RNase PH superfamily)
MFNPISNVQKQFLLSELINNQTREDKRDVEDFREISIKKLEDNGQIELKIGKTLVISQIFAKLISPNKDRANEGVVVFSVCNIKIIFIF